METTIENEEMTEGIGLFYHLQIVNFIILIERSPHLSLYSHPLKTGTCIPHLHHHLLQVKRAKQVYQITTQNNPFSQPCTGQYNYNKLKECIVLKSTIPTENMHSLKLQSRRKIHKTVKCNGRNANLISIHMCYALEFEDCNVMQRCEIVDYDVHQNGKSRRQC